MVLKWNILKHIELDSQKDYFKISKLQFPIIGNNETDIIHIVLKSDISQLNYWDNMVEILLERFLIYNPKSQDDKIRFKDNDYRAIDTGYDVETGAFRWGKPEEDGEFLFVRLDK